MKAGPETIEWLRAFYGAVDAGRYDELAAFLHEDCRCQFPTGAILEGRERILDVMRKSLGTLARVRHQLRTVWEEQNEVIFELEVTYWRTDHRTIVRPGLGVFVIDDGRIREQRLFVDSQGVWD